MVENALHKLVIGVHELLVARAAAVAKRRQSTMVEFSPLGGATASRNVCIMPRADCTDSAFSAEFRPLPRCLASPDAALALFDPLRYQAVEVAVFAYLDPDWRLVGLRQTRPGIADSIPLSLRDIAADVIAWGAAGMVIAHNHPSGDARPSAADRDATRRIALLLGTLQARLIDHFILTRSDTTSFRDAGLI
jgi:DNA repair protein RadC